jgi:hypothetical protein
MKRITEKVMVEWAREHKPGSKVNGLTISQYMQDEEGKVYVAIPLKEFIKKAEENNNI